MVRTSGRRPKVPASAAARVLMPRSERSLARRRECAGSIRLVYARGCRDGRYGVMTKIVPARAYNSWAQSPEGSAARGAGMARGCWCPKPGGVVAVIGLAANDWWDVPYAAVGYSAQLILGFARGRWEHSAPMVWPPPATYLEMKRIASRALPGVRYRRHLLGRYSLLWTKPSQ